jgi:ATP-dependent DNA helicase RecG
LENQNVEWKEKWRDEYLKWVSAFTNAQGGVLVIGKNDIGELVGLEDVAKLMDDLPNKIRNLTGVIADVDLNDNGEKQYICITVKPYPYPISYHGRYYYRSGSTTQELSGSALDEFMLRKQGKTWDGVPVPYVKVDDFENDAFKIFRRKAIESTRLKAEDLQISDEALLGQLQLTEGDYLKRAAILLFHQDPEKCVPGAYVKIGMFASDSDLLFQHEFHGPLISMVDKIMETVYLNYFDREFSVTFYSDVVITIKDTKKDTKNFQTNDTHSRLIAMMGGNPRITVKTMATALKINERNVKKHISALKDLGRIERIGANKSGYWVVKLPD